MNKSDVVAINSMKPETRTEKGANGTSHFRNEFNGHPNGSSYTFITPILFNLALFGP